MKRILMIDDDLRYLEILQLMLEDDGYSVFTSSNGKDLATLIETHEPDVVLMDVLLAEENGVSLAHEYQQRTMTSNTPFIFISAWTGVNDLPLPKNSLKLFKPFSRAELVKAVEQTIGRKESAVTRHV